MGGPGGSPAGMPRAPAQTAAAAPAPAEAAAAPNSPLTAEQIEEIQRQAYDEGFEQGKRDGLAAGQKEMRDQAQRLVSVISNLSRPLADQDDEIVAQLMELVLAAVRMVIRRELKTDPGQIVAVVREAMAALPVGSGLIRVHLYPDDAALIHDALPAADEQQNWKVVEDPTVSRGGCRVVTENSNIDSTLDTRLNTIVAQLMGGEREEDAEGPAGG